LQKHLKDLLDSGKASTMTHAIMSEFYLARKLKATDDGKLDEANRLSAESIKELEAVFKASPMAVKYSNNLAYLYMESNRLDDALKTARTTLEVLQRSGMQGAEHVDELLDTLGWIYQKMDRSTDAVSAFELALRFNPNRIDSREKLAALYRKLGNDGVAEAHEQAIVAIKKAAQEKVEQEKAEKEKSAQDQSVENSEQPAENQQPESAQQPASDSKSEETSNAPSADPAASPGESP
jgi:tetratricopeptide (TPR) repeat protein